MPETRYLNRSMLILLLDRMTAINRIQHNPRLHPYTCGNDSTHELLYPVFEGGRVVLLCPSCDYRQEIPNE